MWKHLHKNTFFSRTFCRVAKHKVKILSVRSTSMTIFFHPSVLFPFIENINRGSESGGSQHNDFPFMLSSSHSSDKRWDISASILLPSSPHTALIPFDNFTIFHFLPFYSFGSDSALRNIHQAWEGRCKTERRMCLTGRSSVVCKISSLRITKHFTSLAFLSSVVIKVSFLCPTMIIFWGARKHYINYPI